MDRDEKRAHVTALRDRIVALITERGQWDGNFDYRGQLTVARKLTTRRLSIEFWRPRHPPPNGLGERTVILRLDGLIVLHVRWQGERQQVVKYEPGGWEEQILDTTS